MPRPLRSQRLVQLAAGGALAALLVVIGFWMRQAARTAPSAPPADQAAVLTGDIRDWTGGLAAAAAERAAGRTMPPQGGPTWLTAQAAPEQRGLQKVPAETPPAAAGHAAPGPAAGEKAASGPLKSSESSAAIERGRALLEQSRFIEARTLLNSALAQETAPRAQAELRELLTRAANESIFSTRRLSDDPLVEIHELQPGELLGAVARNFGVQPEIIAQMSGLRSPDRVGERAKLKVPRGPFHVTVVQSEYRLDLYLQDVYVRSYPVGLGKEKRTPNGAWKVVDRIPNPTYYPSESAEIREVIPGGDPKNPLGGFWLKLEGVEGDAIGQVGYGIHGTNDPASIGKNESLGCVRMRNEDVEFLFKTLRPGKSMVRILP